MPQFQEGAHEILIVEDSPTQAVRLQYILEGHGFKVMITQNGKEALEKLRNHQFTMVISDVVMPEMNGRDLAKSIMALCPGVKCLFMSGYTATAIAHHGVLDEGTNFIQKPFSVKDLAVKVREALSPE